jgi:molybdenum cofactor cytidylyltransferase
LGRRVIGGVVLAAGEGRRFGGPKQLAELDGRPLLEYAVEAVMCVPALDPVVVVLGARADEIQRRVDLLGARPVVCESWQRGQSASLRAAIEALGDVEAALITLGDQPRITPEVIAHVLDEALTRDERWRTTRAVYGGVPGHPVVLPRSLFKRLPELRGDAGARELLETMNVREVEAAHLCSPDDVDTTEQLEALRA